MSTLDFNNKYKFVYSNPSLYLRDSNDNNVFTVTGTTTTFTNLQIANDVKITKTWRSGSNWYRVWSDGFIEQGGIFSENGGVDNKVYTVTYNTTFNNNDYTINITVSSNASWSANIGHVVTNKTTSSFSYYISTNGNANISYGVYWYACGY